MATDLKVDEETPKSEAPAPGDPAVNEQYILDRYKNAIDYYWKSSAINKNAYKRARTWTIILGALVTLISSMASATFIEANNFLNTLFAVATPIIAALLTIITGFSQSFHWGATWRDMVVNASRLEMERDRFMATAHEDKNYVEELALLNSLVIQETENFFHRVLDSQTRSKDK